MEPLTITETPNFTELESKKNIALDGRLKQVYVTSTDYVTVSISRKRIDSLGIYVDVVSQNLCWRGMEPANLLLFLQGTLKKFIGLLKFESPSFWCETSKISIPAMPT